LHGPHLLAASHWTVLLALPAVVALAVTYYLITVLVVLVAITLNSGEPPLAVLTEMGREPLLPEMSLILIGLVLGVIWNTNELLSLLIIAPVMFSIRSFEAVARLRKETIEAVLKMAESIDYRDTQTYEHSQRLAGLTRRLAMRVELTAEHADEVVLASRVHDLGKIGISNDILLKQGPLTPEERKTMEEHPVIGASILANYSAFKTSVDIVRHHHERWDGNGYPDGLRGEEIPMGARIIAVVDAFDAMVADRPYRRGMPVTQAVDRIKDGMGSQFDPKVCAAFLQMLIDEGTYTPPERVPELRIVTAAPASSASAPQAAAR
jgi:HD-GYP domain-containing protein (c-di-GMP phosphodiesterase class II)